MSTTIPYVSGTTTFAAANYTGAGSPANVTLGAGWTSIGDSAFYQSISLTSITIPSTVTSIGSGAFRYASALTSITIPASVTSIAAYALGYTSKLESILVDENNNYYSSLNGVLFNKEKTILLQYPTGNSAVSYTVPMSVETIEGRSFAILNYSDNNTLRTIILNSGLKRINTFAFRYVGILSITIPASVTNIESYVVYGATSLTSVIFAEGSQLPSIQDYTFYGATALTSFIIPASVTSIGGYAFKDASSLTSITIPSNVTSITDYAFNGASNLTSVTINSYLSRIGWIFFGVNKANMSWTFDYNGAIPEGACNGRTFMTSLTIGNQITSIEGGAFQNTALTSVTIPNSVTSIASNAFLGSRLTSALVSVDRLGTTNFPSAAGAGKSIGGKNGVTVTTYKAFIGTGALSQAIVTNANLASNNISNVVISGYTIIRFGAFNGASSVTSITITASVTDIEGTAFQGMTGVTTITIPSSVTSIGQLAFIGMTALTSIVVESSNPNYKSIAGVLFNKTETILLQYPLGKTGTYAIPSGVTSIGDNAFRSAARLTSITIPSSVIEIGNSTFQDSSSLTSIIIPATVTYIRNYAFQGASKLTSLIFEVGSQLTSIGNSGFQGASELTSITIPASVTSIGSYAFGTTPMLTSVIFEGSSQLTTIGGGAFAVSGLTSVTIPSSVTSIGESAFQGSALTTAFFESASTVNTLGLPYGDLINGYIVSSFYDKSSVTIRYTAAAAVAAALAAIAAAPGAVISNSTFTSLFTEMGVNISNMTSEIVTRTNDPYVEYSAKLTIPNGNLSTLSDVKKANIINTVKALYAAQLSVNVNKIIVTLQSGSIIVNVNVLNAGITESMVPICFPKGTPVTTNQGVIAIEKLNPDIHTIRGKKIVAITHSRPLHKYIISIETDALGKNAPSAPIQISKEHKVFYKGKMVKANELVEVCEGVTRIPYNGETLYNVLMEKHDNMMINNVICETLDPKNIMAKICGGKYNLAEQANICKELNDIIKTDNVPAYKKLYASLK